MIVVTGLGVSSLILSRIGWPHPGFFVSTTTTPVDPTKMAVLPPPPFNMKRLSLSFSTSTTFGASACGAPPARCWALVASDSAPTISNTPRTIALFIRTSLGPARAGPCCRPNTSLRGLRFPEPERRAGRIDDDAHPPGAHHFGHILHDLGAKGLRLLGRRGDIIHQHVGEPCRRRTRNRMLHHPSAGSAPGLDHRISAP